MAIAFVANRHSSGVAAVGFGSPLDMAAAGSITVGNHLIMYIAVDNSGTSGIDPQCTGISDPRGNGWNRLTKATFDPAGVNEGAQVEIWISRTVFPYTNGDDLTPIFSFSVERGAFRVNEFSGIRPITYSIITPQTGTGTSTTIAAPAISPTVTGQLVLSAAAVETNTALTGDADTTLGSWSAIGQVASNSGVDATSMTVGEQYKIVTGAGAQNWAATKTGAADFAAASVVLDVFVPVANPFVSSNPNYPCIAGPEITPLTATGFPIDQGTAYMFSHKVFPNDYGSQKYAFVASVNPTAAPEIADPISQHHVCGDIYLSGNENVVNDPIYGPTCFLAAITLGPGAEVWNPDTDANVPSGGGPPTSEFTALSSPGGNVIKLESGEYIDVRFETSFLTTYYANHRVVRWGIRYLAYKDDGSPPTPDEGIQVYVHDTTLNSGTGSNYLAGGWLVNNYRGTVEYETRWVGEVNANPRLFASGPISIESINQRACWTLADLAHMQPGDATIFMRIEGVEAEVYLDYMELVVELAPERRLAHGCRIVSTAPFSDELFLGGARTSPVVMATNAALPWTVPSADNTYVLVLREPLPASPSDLYPVQVENTGGDRTLSSVEAVGAPLRINGLLGTHPVLVPQPIIRQAVYSNGTLKRAPEELAFMQAMGVSTMDAVNYPLEGTFFPSYDALAVGSIGHVYSGLNKNQYIVVPGGQQYTTLKVLVRPDQLTTANLSISIQQPPATPIATATITKAAVDALPDLGHGFKEISVTLSVPITPSAGRVYLVFSSTTALAAPWTVQAGVPSFSYSGYDTGSPTNLTEPFDFSVVLQCALAAPTYAISNGAGDLERYADRCLAPQVAAPIIELQNAATYDWVSVERTIDGGFSYTALQLFEDPANFDILVDYSVPWDLPSGTVQYRITGYRNADRKSVSTLTTAWMSVATSPGAAFGLAILGPNFDGDLFAYVPSQGSGDLEVEWNPLNPISTVQLHGVDYSVALRSPEERGLELSVPIVVDHLTCPSTDDFIPGSWVTSKGQQAMAPTPFDTLRSLESYPRLALMLPGGHTRFVSLDLGSMTIRTATGLYIAEITLTDVTLPEVNPYD